MTEEQQMMAEEGTPRINIKFLVVLLVVLVVLTGAVAVGIRGRIRTSGDDSRHAAPPAKLLLHQGVI